ncbi:carbamoyltransferase C-terminal domain-containing protein [Polynucleobacter necessarius]|uniref:carbamoyltransferase C-terminal domain-containing protein n=1 Tax=Polynucleobacter necessarius TaxID=576610 RepID=UPI0013B06052|nr:carbamoyltransferase C-terminal domain-containing protein [Polynucleobacter necessarius]
MAITFESTPLAREHLSAAVHPRDFTMRPQAVLKDWNPGCYKVIESFSKKTGIAGILNTSFNLHGEPNVSTPEDAIRERCGSLGWIGCLLITFSFIRFDDDLGWNDWKFDCSVDKKQ